VTFAGINYLAIMVAAVLAWLASAVWYMSLGKHYAAALGKTPERVFALYLYAFIADIIIIAWMLAGLLGHLGAGQVTFRNGVISGAFLWFGFVLTTMTVRLLRPRSAALADRCRQLADRVAGDGRGDRAPRRVAPARLFGVPGTGRVDKAPAPSLVRRRCAVA